MQSRSKKTEATTILLMIASLVYWYIITLKHSILRCQKDEQSNMPPLHFWLQNRLPIYMAHFPFWVLHILPLRPNFLPVHNERMTIHIPFIINNKPLLNRIRHWRWCWCWFWCYRWLYNFCNYWFRCGASIVASGAVPFWHPTKPIKAIIAKTAKLAFPTALTKSPNAFFLANLILCILFCCCQRFANANTAFNFCAILSDFYCLLETAEVFNSFIGSLTFNN